MTNQEKLDARIRTWNDIQERVNAIAEKVKLFSQQPETATKEALTTVATETKEVADLVKGFDFGSIDFSNVQAGL